MSNDSPLVTTVITTFQRPALLRRALRSVLSQSYSAIRVCIYDDASGDETADTVREFIRTDPRVEYYQQDRNIGAPQNFSFGAQRVSTPYFSILSDDDILLPDFYTRALSEFGHYPQATMAMGDTLYVGDGRKSFGRCAIAFPPGFYGQPEGLLAMSRYPQPSWTGILFRREVLDRVGGIDTSLFSMDYDFVLRAAAVSPYIVFHDPVAMFSVHPGQSTAMLRLHMIWPTRYTAMERVLQTPALRDEVRDEVRSLLTANLGRLLFQIGLRSLATNEFEEAEQIGAILKDPLQFPGKQRVLSTLGAMAREHESIRRVLFLMYRFRRFYIVHRATAQNTDLKPFYEYYEQLG